MQFYVILFQINLEQCFIIIFLCFDLLRINIVYCMISPLGISILILLISVTECQTTCQYNTKCDVGCFNFTCIYDPSTNSYYNSSIDPKSPVYHGKACCNGCESSYYYYQYGMACYSNGCPKDQNGTQTFAYNNVCYYSCLDVNLYGNPDTNTCQSTCPSTYVVFHPLTGTCLTQCPEGFYQRYAWSNYQQRHCRKVCQNQTGTYGREYGDDETGKCVRIHECSYRVKDKYQTFADNATSLCRKVCSDGSYAHQDIKVCVKQCFGDFPYYDNDTNRCVKTGQEQNSIQAALKKSIQTQIFASLQTQAVIYVNQTKTDLRSEMKSQIQSLKTQLASQYALSNATVQDKSARQSIQELRKLFIIGMIVIIFLVLTMIVLFISYSCYIKNKLRIRLWQMEQQSVPQSAHKL